MEIYIFLVGIICLAIGYVAAKIELRKELRSERNIAFNRGWLEGNDKALQDREAVKKAYFFHFGNHR